MGGGRDTVNVGFTFKMTIEGLNKLARYRVTIKRLNKLARYIAVLNHCRKEIRVFAGFLLLRSMIG